MPFFAMEVSIDGILKMRAVRLGYTARLQDFSPAFQQIGADFRATEATYFSQGGALVRWAPLMLRYAKWKARVSSGPILTLYGPLGASMAQAGADGNIDRVGPHLAVFGSSLLAGKSSWGLARTHQYGRGGDNEMAARPMLQFDDTTYRRWREFVRQHVMGER